MFWDRWMNGSADEESTDSKGSEKGETDKLSDVKNDSSTEKPAGDRATDVSQAHDQAAGDDQRPGSEWAIEAPGVARVELPAETDPAVIVERLLGDNTPRREPSGAVLTAEIDRQSIGPLHTVAAELQVRRRDTHPVLVAIPHHYGVTDALVDAFDTTLLVAPNKRRYLPLVRQYLPALFSRQTGDLGSGRVFTVDIGDAEPKGDAVNRELRAKKGEPLHELGDVEFPEYYAFAAPPDFHEVARRALDDLGEVVYTLETDASVIQVVGFTFINAGDRTRTTPTPEDFEFEWNGGPDNHTPFGFTAPENDSSARRPAPDASAGDSGSASATMPGDPDEQPSGPGATETTMVPGSTPTDEEAESTTEDKGAESPTTDAGSESPPDEGSDPSVKPSSSGYDPPTDGSGKSPSRPDRGRSPETTTEPEPDAPDGAGATGTDPLPDTAWPDSDGAATDGDSEPDVPNGTLAPDSSGGSSPESEPSSGPDADGTPENDNPEAPRSGRQPPSRSPSPDGTATTPSPDGAEGMSPPSSDGRSPPAEGSDSSPSRQPDRPAESTQPPDNRPDVDGTGSAPTPNPDSAPDSDSGSDSALPRPAPDGDGGPDTTSRPSPSPDHPDETSPDDGPSLDPDGLPGVPNGSPSSGNDSPTGTSPPDAGWDGTTRVPPEYKPGTVAITKHALNEAALHAAVHEADGDAQETYGTLYANDAGVIRYYNPVDSEEYVLRNGRSVVFKPAFKRHLQELARHHREVDHRLAGDCHSHPTSGVPKQSPQDKDFNQRVWSNERNTELIIGISDGTGPDEWTLETVATDDGKETVEARKQLGNKWVRIRAYSGTNAPKDIEIKHTMGG